MGDVLIEEQESEKKQKSTVKVPIVGCMGT